MKEELNKLIGEFYQHIEWFNREKRQPLEDDIEPTFSNFAKWLNFEVYKGKNEK